jgi:hypothetical protein
MTNGECWLVSLISSKSEIDGARAIRGRSGANRLAAVGPPPWQEFGGRPARW